MEYLPLRVLHVLGAQAPDHLPGQVAEEGLPVLRDGVAGYAGAGPHAPRPLQIPHDVSPRIPLNTLCRREKAGFYRWARASRKILVLYLYSL